MNTQRRTLYLTEASASKAAIPYTRTGHTFATMYAALVDNDTLVLDYGGLVKIYLPDGKFKGYL